MKKLLLTSALVAVAGAAAAEITWSGSAEVYYNDTTKGYIGTTTQANGDVEADGVYYFSNTYLQGRIDDGASLPLVPTAIGNPLHFEAGLDAAASTELDNGITATLAYQFTLDDFNTGTGVIKYDNNFPTLTIEAPMFTVAVGNVDHAAHALWTGHSETLEFTEEDGELVGRIDGTISGFSTAVSYVASDASAVAADTADIYDDFEGLPRGSWTVGAKGEFAGATVSVAYEERGGFGVPAKDYTDQGYYRGVFGIAGGYEWNGIKGTLSYITADLNLDDNYETSIGIKASYDWNGYTLYGEAANYDDGLDDDSMTPGVHTYTDWKVGAKGEVQGFGFDVYYHDDNDFVDNDYAKGVDGNEGFGADLSYEWNGATFIAGFDTAEAVNYVNSDTVYNAIGATDISDLRGGYYVGATYAIGEGASVYASYANADEIDPDEWIDAGFTVGMKLSF